MKVIKGVISQFINRLFPETANFTKDSVIAEEKKAREGAIRKFNK